MKAASIVLLALLAGGARAQQIAAWQGEWGAFTGDHAQEGRRLSVHDCRGTTCRFSLEARLLAGHAETAGDQTLLFQADGTATASLPDGSGKAACSLRFERRNDAKPVVQVMATGAVCTSYYATGPAVSFSGVYPRQADTPYSGMHADECFLGRSPALLAMCTHPELSKQEVLWEDLAEAFPLQSPAKGEAGQGSPLMKMDAALLASCDSSPDPQACLAARFSSETATMQARQAAYLSGTEDRGDPGQGGALARKIAGQYRHSAPNGDVQGDKYTTTDTLTITPVGTASIHFKALLNFYNGHQCSLDGGALYRRDGSFVFDDKPENANFPDTPACRLAIVPNGTGVTFRDITGGCKTYCGARGSWNGAGFTFSQRIQPVPVSAKK